MIERYWSEVFGKFEVSPGKFEIPGFPEPLMSVHFGKQNIVGESRDDSVLRFFLCEFDNSEFSPSAHKCESEPLEASLSSQEFWDFQKEEGPESYEFMSRFLPFVLGKSKGNYIHYFIRTNNVLSASVIVGVSTSSALFINGLVAKKERGRAMAKSIFECARADLSPMPVFFWTKHPFLKLGADRVIPYELLTSGAF